MRILICEDSALLREGLVRVLEDSGHEVVAALPDGSRLDEAVDTRDPQLCILDVRLPPTWTDEGIRAAEHIRRTHPETGVVVLSQYSEPTYALGFLEGGSEGRAYLLKERVSDLDQLHQAIVAVHEGGSVIDAKVVDALVASRARRTESPVALLTPREREVLAEMAQGKNNAGIAAALVLSERAIEKHINSMFSKLGLSEEPDVHRRVTAVLLYIGAQGG